MVGNGHTLVYNISMVNMVSCPACGHSFSPDEILTHELEKELTAKLTDQLKQKLQAQADLELKDKENQIQELKKKALAAEAAELKLRAEKRAIEEAKEKFELEKTRQLDLERQKIQAETTAKILEQEKYKREEYEKKLRDMQKALEDAQRKGSQGSQQLQGEVQELDLESTLRALYVYDEIGEVKKGENGADIRQLVKTEKGTLCGKILWESKRTKSFSESWVTKLKEDMRRDQSHLGVIITQAMPNGITEAIVQQQGIWITTPPYLRPLSALLRKNLIDIARERHVAAHKQTTAESLYDYVTSSQFSQNVERMVRVYLDMKTQISKEAAAAEKNFKARSMQVDILLSGITGIYGDMEGIAGSSLPPLSILEKND